MCAVLANCGGAGLPSSPVWPGTGVARGWPSPRERNQVGEPGSSIVTAVLWVVGSSSCDPGFLFTQWGFALRPPILPSQLRVACLSPSTRSLGARLLTVSSLFRELQDEDLQKFCSRLRKLLQQDPGPEAADTLQRLFFIMSATKYNRK